MKRIEKESYMDQHVIIFHTHEDVMYDIVVTRGSKENEYFFATVFTARNSEVFDYSIQVAKIIINSYEYYAVRKGIDRILDQIIVAALEK